MSGESDVRFSLNSNSDYSEYDKPINIKDVKAITSIHRKSVSNFNSDEIKKAQKWAYKYFKEIGAKSPFFRNWFGDWRANDKSNVDVVKIPAYDRNSVNNQKGEVTNKDTGWNIRISHNGLTNTIYHSGKQRQSIEGLQNLKGLIENAVLLDTETHEIHGINSNNRIAFDHKLYALGEGEDGGIALYKMTVEEIYQSDNSPYEKRFHNLKYIEKVADGLYSLTDKPNGNRAESVASATSKISVAEIYNYVKQYDSEFKGRIDTVDSRLLDEDGKPKIFYHGSRNKFDEFKHGDFGVRGSNEATEGFYFSPFEEGAEVYSGKRFNTGYVYPVYLSIKNPYIAKDYIEISTLNKEFSIGQFSDH